MAWIDAFLVGDAECPERVAVVVDGVRNPSGDEDAFAAVAAEGATVDNKLAFTLYNVEKLICVRVPWVSIVLPGGITTR